MKAPLSWLKEYTPLTCDAEALARALTRGGLEVAAIEERNSSLGQVVTGKVLNMSKHPDADKLWVCTIDVGSEQLCIVTGAQNVIVGAIVPVALVGAELPGGLQIKPAKLRGIASFGMLCSAAELAIDAKLLMPEEREGIFLLPLDVQPGLDIDGVLGLNEPVLELEPTPNRADCFSVVGVAREAAVAQSCSLTMPHCQCQPQCSTASDTLISVEISDFKLCQRFSAKVLRDVAVKPSPLWLQNALRAAGMRPINNVVDVTNYVMLELGQPMHAYDADKIQGAVLRVRCACAGERITTLDGIKRELSEDMLVIADAERTVGIAGIMGGLDTEVSAATTTIIMEAASFSGKSIRRAARALGLRSEASSRFERGIDIGAIHLAQERAAHLLQSIGAVKACSGMVDIYPQPLPQAVIECSATAINTLLGTHIAAQQQCAILNSLGIRAQLAEDMLTAIVPSWRADITLMQDLAEEIGRIYGYDEIPLRMPVQQITRGGQLHIQTIADKVRSTLAACSMSEVINFSFIHPQAFDKLNWQPDDARRQAIVILNPIVAEFPLMRTTLADSLLNNIKTNAARKNDDIKIYELASVYLTQHAPQGIPANEVPHICGALTGKQRQQTWYSGKQTVDFYDAKGAVEELLAAFNIEAQYERLSDNPQYHPGKSCAILVEGRSIGCVGEVHPAVAAHYDISQSVYMFEINQVLLAEAAAAKKPFHQLPRYQTVKRDLALVLPLEIAAQEVLDAICDAAPALLAAVNLFDCYSGERMTAGKKSLGYSLYLQAEDRTLTDKEIEACIEAIVGALQARFDVEIRIA